VETWWVWSNPNGILVLYICWWLYITWSCNI
jgi:hypothetical protein